ncbi:MAG: radical SAM protein [Desulfobulbaceae bacterium]|nr:radical SAM protein [Desulfobulbaceae bacterium]
MLLIFPPIAKSCEPPAGITSLAGVLRKNGINCTVFDANLEAQLHLISLPAAATDTWTKRAERNRIANLAALHTSATYASLDRYRRSVMDLNRLLDKTAPPGLSISLVNYQDNTLSPLRSADLLTAATHPEENIFHGFFSLRLRELLGKSSPAMVGFSLNYLSQALPTFAIIGFLRREYPNLKIVLGGGLITSWLASSAWNNPFGDLVDHLVAGPGEAPLLRLLGAESLQVETPPDFRGLPLKDYLAPGLILPYSASRGCYWRRCSFCPEKAEGAPYLAKSPQQVLADLKLLVEHTRPTLIHLLDNAVSPALLRAMAEQPPGAEWYGFARAEPLLADPVFCRRLRQSGCVMLKLGLESGDQGVLDALDKGIDLGLVSQVLAALAEAGIATYVYLLFGTPAETAAEAIRTMEFVAQHCQEITFLNLAIFNLPVGSPEVNTLEIGNFYGGDLSLYHDFRHPRGWNRREVRQFLAHEFKRHPKIAPILRRDPPFFTSNHAPFLRS